MSSGASKKRVLLVDDHTLVRSGFKALLQEVGDAEGLEIAGEAVDGQTAIERALELKPDIILMDLRLPDMSGIEATRRILAALPKTRIIALSVYTEPQFVSEMLRAGAYGYLPKDCATVEFREAIEAVSNGHRYLGRTIASGLAEDISGEGVAEQQQDLSTLTKREMELLSLFAEGLSVKETAEKLRLSIHTVYTHRKNIMQKLGLTTNAELMRFIIRSGLTPF